VTQIIELKNEEILKLNNKISDARREFSMLRAEVDQIDTEKDNLREENVNRVCVSFLIF
jgi:hypothetical protein